MSRTAVRRADDHATSSVRFNGEAVRLFQRNCRSCSVLNGLVVLDEAALTQLLDPPI